MARINPEVRAAEIFAAIVTDYRDGGWFAIMTPGERVGWNIHEDQWWSPDESPEDHDWPANAREMAGWLAREIWSLHTYGEATHNGDRWVEWSQHDEPEPPDGYRVDYSRTELTARGYRAPIYWSGEA